ncbi:MAG: hypothetical protein G8345_09040 [Magnetococcales bacterium]|nr:hypothetical protein [Magnetococcales bacterium]
MSNFSESGGNDFTNAGDLGVLVGDQTGNQSVEGWVGAGDSYDYFQFQVNQVSAVSLALTDLTANANLYLFDPSGTLLLASSTNSGTSSEAIGRQLSAGIYYVRVANTPSNSTGYTLNLTSNPDKGGNSTGAAGEIGLLSATEKTTTEWVGSGDSLDLFRFSVGNVGDVLIKLSGLTADASLQLLNDSGSSVLATSTATGTTGDVINQQLTAGTYYARVVRPNNTATSYTIHFTANDETGGNTTTAATNLGSLSNTMIPQTGWTGTGDSYDFYGFTLGAAGNVTLALGDLTGDANLALYNENGSLIVASSQSGTRNERIERQLTGGSYLVGVSRVGTANSPYTLVMSGDDDTGINTTSNFSPIDFTPNTLSGWLGSANTYDLYTFVMSTSGQATLTLSGLLADANLALYDASGESLLDSSSLTGTTNDVIVSNLSAGTYLARVDRGEDTSTRYTLNLQTSDEDDTFLSNAFNGWVGSGDTYDYYRFILTTVSHVGFTLTNLQEDANLALFNETGSILLTSSTQGQTKDDVILYNLSAGTYLARVSRSGSNDTPYTLQMESESDTGGDTAGLATSVGTLSSTPYTATGWLGNNDNHDYLLFNMGTTGNVNLALSDLQADANLYLYSSNGATLLASSTGTGINNESIGQQLSGGVYAVRVSRNGSAVTDYTLVMTATEDTGGNNFSNAAILGTSLGATPLTQSGWVGAGDSLDYFRFETTADGNVQLNLLDLADNANLFLYNSSSVLITSSQLTGVENEFVSWQLSAGFYFAKVSSVSSAKTDYTLTLQNTPDPAGNATGAAFDLETLTTTVTQSGWVGGGGSHDYYKFYVGAIGNVSLSLTNLLANADLYLFNGTGSVQVANSRLTGVSAESIQYQLTVGTYFARVTANGGNTTYNLAMQMSNETGGDATSPTNAGILSTAETSKSGWVGNLNTHDYYRFEINTTGNVTLLLTNLDADANLYLYSGSTLVASSTNTKLKDDLIEQQLAKGTYLARVTRSGTNNSNYALFMSTSEDSGGNSTGTAAPQGTLSTTPVTVSGWLGTGDNTDYFKFGMDAVGNATITLSGLEGEANLQLYSENGATLIASSSTSGTLDDIIEQQLGIGTYLAKVTRSGTSTTNFDLTLTSDADTGGEATTNASDLGTLTSSWTTATGWVGSGDAYDTFQFTVTNPGNLTLILSDLRADANLQLFTATGTQITTSSLSGISNDTIQYQLTAGNYVARVSRQGSFTTDYSLDMKLTADTGGTTAGGATTLNELVTQTGWVGMGDTYDFYKFTMAALGDVNLALTGLTADANLHLYNSDGTTLLASSTNSLTTAESIQQQLSAGNYVVRVSRGSATTNSDYSLLLDMEADNGGNTTTTPSPAGTLSEAGTPIYGWVGAGDTNDFFQFSVAEDGDVALLLQGLTADANLYLYNGDGSTLLGSSVLTGTSDEIIHHQLTTGNTYLVKVSRGSNTNSDYTLVLTNTPDTGGSQPNESEDRGILTVNQWMNGSVSSSDTLDVFQFVLGETSNVTLLLNGLSDDANLALYNSSTVLLGSSQQDNALSESIHQQLAAGTYFASVIHADGAGTDYNLHILPTADLGGDDVSQARNLGNLRTTLTSREWLGTGDDQDFFLFAVTRNTMITLGLSDLTDNADLFFLNSDGSTVLASSTEAGDTDESIIRQISAGTYLVRVAGTITDNQYQLDISGYADPGESTSTALSVGSLGYSPITYTGWLGDGDTYDYYRFVVSSRRMVNIDLFGLDGTADIKLLSANGSVILSYPGYNGTQSESISQELANGTYYAAVLSYSGNTNYSLVLDTDQNTSGSDKNSAQNLGLLTDDTALQGWVGAADGTDVYRFSLSQATTLSLRMEDLYRGATVGLFDHSGYIILPQASYNTLYEGTINRQVTAGVYYVRVMRYVGDNDYTINLDLGDTTAGDTIATAWNLGTINTARLESGTLLGSDQQDVYRFEVATTGNFTITLYNFNNDSNLQLLNGNEENLAVSRNLGLINDVITMQLTSGTYYARVSRYSGETNYQLQILNTTTTPTPLQLGHLSNNTRTLYDWVGSHDEGDYYAVILQNTSSLTMTLSGMGADADLFLMDYADWQSGNLHTTFVNWMDQYSDNVLAASQNVGSTDETLTRVVAPGTYYVSVRQREGNTQYQLQLTASDSNASVNATTSINATTSSMALGSLSGSLTVNGLVDDADGVNFYSFTLNSQRYVTLTLSDITADADLYLLDDFNWDTLNPDNPLLSFLDNWESHTLKAQEGLGTTEKITSTRLSAGTYYVAVMQGSGDSTYTLNLTATNSSGAPPMPLTDSPTNDATSSLEVGLMTRGARITRTGGIGGNDNGDGYRFQLAQESQFSVSAVGSQVDMALYLYNEGNQLVGQSGGGGIGVSESCNLSLASGSYRLELRSSTATTGEYSLVMHSV